MMKKLIFCTAFLILYFPHVKAADLRGRMGVGMSNQLANDLPALSLKIQKSKTTAFGGMLGFKSDKDHSLYGAAVKAYRLIFDEPQLNFYLAGTFAALNFPDGTSTKSGWQFDGTMGSEFHFAGLESLGFSFEFGFSVNDAGNGTTFETLGQNFLKAAIHFYL